MMLGVDDCTVCTEQCVVNETGKQVVFAFRRNWSGPTAGLRRLSGSEFQTVGPAEAKERQPKVLQRTRGTVS